MLSDCTEVERLRLQRQVGGRWLTRPPRLVGLFPPLLAACEGPPRRPQPVPAEHYFTGLPALFAWAAFAAAPVYSFVISSGKKSRPRSDCWWKCVSRASRFSN